MIKEIGLQFKIALKLLMVLTGLTGLMYPLFVMGFAQLFFPWQANGSLIQQDGKLLGSVLIGQSFVSPGYFWGRPSETMPTPYNGAASLGANDGPSNPVLWDKVEQRAKQLVALDPGHRRAVPVDLVTASGSGLDPEISLDALLYQVPRIASIRHLSEDELRAWVMRRVQWRTLGLLGEPRVNVFQLNRDLYRFSTRTKK